MSAACHGAAGVCDNPIGHFGRECAGSGIAGITASWTGKGPSSRVLIACA